MGLITSPPFDALHDLEIKFLCKKHALPESTVQDVAHLFFALRMGVIGYSQEVKKHLTTALSFPTDVTKPVFNKSKLDSSFAVHSPDVKDALESIAFGLSKTEAKKSVFFFIGHPGTGKTYGAEAIAESVGLPSCNINHVAGQNMGDLMGILIRKIAQCMIDKSTLNPVMILNDIDRAIMEDQGIAASFLSLLDRQQKTIYNPFLGMDMDISRLTFIMTGNSDFEGEAFAALNGRIRGRVTFLPPSLESLKTVMKGGLDQYLKANPGLDLSSAELDGVIERMLIKDGTQEADYRTFGLGLESAVDKMAKEKSYKKAAIASRAEVQEEQCKVYPPFTHGFSKATEERALNR